MYSISSKIRNPHTPVPTRPTCHPTAATLNGRCLGENEGELT